MRQLFRSATAVIATLASSPAFAHIGEHGHMTTAELLDHAGSAGHTALLALLLALVGGAVWIVRRSMAERANQKTRTRSGQRRQP